jgi:L-lactate dehydrogenase (cytochrome)
VLKAVALGAKGTYIGRPFLYGLGAMGKDGVSLALNILRKEMDVTMALCGKRDINEVNSSIIAGRQ